jgi:hypothetical protein
MNSKTDPRRLPKRPMKMRIIPRPPAKTSEPRVGSGEAIEGFSCIKVMRVKVY